MRHRIRMIGLDLDGTLLNDKKELTPRTKERWSLPSQRELLFLWLPDARGRVCRKN